MSEAKVKKIDRDAEAGWQVIAAENSQVAPLRCAVGLLANLSVNRTRGSNLSSGGLMLD